MASEPSSKPPKARRKSHTSIQAEAEAQAQARTLQSAIKTYGRGEKVKVKSVRDKKLRSNLRTLENKHKDAALQAKNAEILLPDTPGLLEAENELERTDRVRQDQIREAVGVETAKKGFELRLDNIVAGEYTRNGRDLLLAGRHGQIACFDWRAGKLGCELQLNETIRDAKWLHNNQSFAVAQKKCVYIYAHDGVELHCLKKHQEATHLQFLPYHFLLSSVSTAGVLRYTDTSTGQMVAELPTKLGPPTSFGQNPANAVLHVGHQKGLVTLWSPNSPTPLVRLLPHHGPVRALAVNRAGNYLVSTAQDRRMSIFDVRMFKELNSLHLRQPGSSLSISDQNLTAVGWGTQVSVYKQDIFNRAPEDVQASIPYMSWGGEGNTISSVRFCPFEDALGVSHNNGFTSMLVPGSAEANWDALEPGLNPYETSKQRRETEVHSLLEKLKPEMISLDPNMIGKLDLASEEQRRHERNLDARPTDKIAELKKRGRGRNSALRRHLRKSGQKNVIDEEKTRARETLKAMNKREIEKVSRLKKEYGPALERFARKGF